MLEDIDLSNIQDENARQLIVRLLNLIEALSTDLRDAQAEIQRLRDENQSVERRARQAQDQGQHAQAAPGGLLVGERAAQTQTPPEASQEGQTRDSSRTDAGSGQSQLAAGCRVQGLRRRCGAGRHLSRRQRVLPQGEVLGAVDGPNLSGPAATGVRGAVWARAQSPDA